MESNPREAILLTPAAAAQRLSLGRSTLYQLVLSGEIKSIKIGKSRRIPAAALAEYVDQKLREQGG